MAHNYSVPLAFLHEKVYDETVSGQEEGLYD